jgi:hypothetical protein
VKKCCLKHLLGEKLEDTGSPHSGPSRNTCALPPQPVGAQPSVAPYQVRRGVTAGTPNVSVAADMRRRVVERAESCVGAARG